MDDSAGLGVGLALLATVLFGLYMAPRKESPACQRAYAFWMGFGALVGSQAIGLAYQGLPRITGAQYALIFLSGVVWSTGAFGYSTGVRLIGLYRSTPVKNTSAILGTFTGLVVFHEFSLRHAAPLAMVIAGSAAVLASAVVLSGIEPSAQENSREPGMRRLMQGVAWSFWGAAGFTLYGIPMKIVYAQGVTPFTFLFFMGQGVFVGMCVLSLLSGSRSCIDPITWRDRGLAQLSGLMWAAGALCINIAVKLVGIAVTWPLSRSGLVTVLFGALVLREFDLGRFKTDLAWGLALSVVGVALLGLAAFVR